MKVLRIPITASDFVVGNYFTLDDTNNDYSLDDESLDPISKYTIPVLQDILNINSNIKIMLCPWTAPTWLKTSNSDGYPANFENGALNNDAYTYDTYAKYLVKVLDLFKNIGIDIWALSLQNEPLPHVYTFPLPSTNPLWLIPAEISFIFDNESICTGVYMCCS